MSAVWFRACAEMRARWRASLALAGVIGLAGGLVLGAATGARRQDSTFPLFRVAQNTAQLGIANSGQVFGFANVNFDYARRLPQVVDTAPFQAFLGFTTLVLLALIVGIPLGVAAGRWSWTTFSNQLGYVPEPVVRLLPIILTIPAALLLGNLIAALPARAAARTRPALVLRAE